MFTVLTYAPEQVDGMLTYVNTLRGAHELGPGLRDLAILSLGSASGGDYTVFHHPKAALRAGFTDEQIAAIPQAEVSSLFDDAELAAIRFARAVGSGMPVNQEPPPICRTGSWCS